METHRCLLLLVLALLVGCPGPASWHILINRTDAAVTVRFALRTYQSPTLGETRCPLTTGEARPRLMDLNQFSLRKTSQWRDLPLAGARVEAACQLTVEVPAGFGLALQSHDVCADAYQTYGATRQPRLRLLEVAAASGTATYTDWQAVKLFKRKNDDFCLFEFR